MSEREEELKARVRETPLPERLTECRRRIGKMCSEGRPPRMTIPVQHSDDDFFICTTLEDAREDVARLRGLFDEAYQVMSLWFKYFNSDIRPISEWTEVANRVTAWLPLARDARKAASLPAGARKGVRDGITNCFNHCSGCDVECRDCDGASREPGARK